MFKVHFKTLRMSIRGELVQIETFMCCLLWISIRYTAYLVRDQKSSCDAYWVSTNAFAKNQRTELALDTLYVTSSTPTKLILVSSVDEFWQSLSGLFLVRGSKINLRNPLPSKLLSVVFTTGTSLVTIAASKRQRQLQTQHTLNMLASIASIIAWKSATSCCDANPVSRIACLKKYPYAWCV